MGYDKIFTQLSARSSADAWPLPGGGQLLTAETKSLKQGAQENLPLVQMEPGIDNVHGDIAPGKPQGREPQANGTRAATACKGASCEGKGELSLEHGDCAASLPGEGGSEGSWVALAVGHSSTFQGEGEQGVEGLGAREGEKRREQGQ